MSRSILDESKIHPAILSKVANFQADLLAEVQAAVAGHAVVVVGMGLNPFPRMARRILDQLGVPYHYLGYGSYLSQWRRRTALKMWTGWQTFPMVFVNGTLIGGAQELRKLVDSGQFAKLVSSTAPL